MLNKGKALKIFTGLVLISIGLVQPAKAYAYGRDNQSYHRHHDNFRFYKRHHHPYHYPPYGKAVLVFPHGLIKIVIGGRPYHYYDGVYYQSVSNQYVVVAPPLGAVIETLPRGYDEVYIKGKVYYVSNGAYYRYCPKGYEVVGDPRDARGDNGKYDDADDRAQASKDEFTIHIKNNSSGYTPVVLKKADNGYIGPQGEFYPSFPKVAQLKVIYGN